MGGGRRKLKRAHRFFEKNEKINKTTSVYRLILSLQLELFFVGRRIKLITKMGMRFCMHESASMVGTI